MYRFQWRLPLLATLLGGALALGACAPALDWREIRPSGAALVAMLPCKPSTFERQVQLAGTKVALGLQACTAGSATWAIAWADVGDPAIVGAALRELQASARANLGAQPGRSLPLAPPGATPNPATAREALTGRLPDGKSVEEQVAVFTRGTQVFQATVVAPRIDTDAADTFFASLRAGS